MGLIIDHYFVYDGMASIDFGVLIAENVVYNKPEREYDKVSVPGKNGDLFFDKKKYSNVPVTYKCVIRRDYQNRLSEFANFILSRKGYLRLEDTSNPEEYRLACCVGGIDPSTVPRENAGVFDVQFDCKPQRFLKSGENVLTYTANSRIRNITTQEALPLIRVYGAGVLGIGSTTLTIGNHGKAYMDIDCDMQDAFNGGTNLNNYVTLSSGEFPRLVPGENGISLGSGITKVEIIPRWWRL